MFDEQKLYALVARELKRIPREQYADNRGVESAPYARHASPMARYQPMIRMLDDEDFALLKLARSEKARFREQRRRIYDLYVDDLERVIEGLLKQHAESGACSLDELQKDTKSTRNCIAQLRRHAWRHWIGLGGVPEMVAETLQELTAALRYGVLVEMPLPAQAIA
jgi:hypothetical protein